MLAGTSFLSLAASSRYFKGTRLCIGVNKCGGNSKMEPTTWNRDAPDSANGHLHLFCVAVCRFAVGAELQNQSCRSASHDSSRVVKAGGSQSWRTMSGGPRNELPPAAQQHRGKPGREKTPMDLWIPANMCPVWGSPSWRWDEGRIDWRWWTINEGIDFRVRVAGWGLEINWNKDINTSTGLPPGHAHTFSQIYYETCLA